MRNADCGCKKIDKMLIYNHLPIGAQNLACCYEGFKIRKNRYGELFWKALADYESRSKWPYEQICEYRDQLLRKLLKHCYETVPYYTRMFREYGINYESVRRLEDLQMIPVLTKDMVKENFNEFLSSSYKRSELIQMHTSGTTGSGFQFNITQKQMCEQWAVWWRYRRSLGIAYDTWCAVFGGRSVVPLDQKKNKFYRINYPGKQVYFSAYHLSKENMDSYINALEKYKITWIHGYPSVISLIADYMLETEMKLSSPVRYITTGAENLNDLQKEKIFNAFGTYPYQHYGLSEGVANISENKNHNLIVDEDYAAVEFIKSEIGESYSIIGTSLTGYAMPFVRYATNDLAQVEVSSRSVFDIDGRQEDYVLLKNGAKIGRLDHIFKDLCNIREAQIIQKKNKHIIFLVVKKQAYTKTDEVKLTQEIESRIGKGQYSIQYTDQIVRSSSGKLRFVISEV